MWYLAGARSRLRMCSEISICESFLFALMLQMGNRNDSNCRISDMVSNDRGI